MPCITFPIDPVGPVLEVGIAAPSALLPAGTPTPQIHWFRAIADTGCSLTAIHSTIADAAGLKAISKGQIVSATQTVNVDIYLGDLFLRVPLGNSMLEIPFRNRRFTQLLFQTPNYDALLGMDVFNTGTLHVNGITKNVTFCW